LYTDKVMSAKSKELWFKPFLSNYAYGWIVIKTPVEGIEGGLTTVAHGGGINGFNTLITRLVDDKHLIVLLNNAGQGRLNEITREVANILYDQPFKLPKKPDAATPAAAPARPNN
jgi:hypothetical protein